MNEKMFSAPVPPRVERTKDRDPHEKLSQALALWAEKINTAMAASLERPEAAGRILDPECRVDMRAFGRERGGPYAEKDEGNRRGIESDEALVHTHELAWSGAREAWAKKRYGTDDEDEIVRRYREGEKRRDGAMAEAAVICVLNRFLGSRYAVVRASLYDDYENGVDTLILDKEHGGVVCAFDEVVGIEGDDRYARKVSRAKEKLTKQGGMRVRYGLAFDHGADKTPKLSRKSMPNVPGFCVSLTKDGLHALLRHADFSGTTNPSHEEYNVLGSVVAALERQEEVFRDRMTAEQQRHIADLIVAVREAGQR